MNLDLSEDEAMLKAATERFVSDRYAADRRAYLAQPHGFASENWAAMSELGLTAAAFPVASGGLGIGAAGLATIFEALGRGLVVEPLAENAVLAGRLFDQLAPAALREQLLPELIAGTRRVALAHSEHRARKNQARVETAARENGTATYLTGEKSLVPGGAGADGYLVSARISGQPDDPDGVALFFVGATAPGLSVNPWRTIDGGVAVSLSLRDVAVDAGSCLGGSLAAIEAAQLHASLARSAEALGIMETLFAQTLDYLRTRRQFGKPLGSFQALQHRMVAQYAVLEEARGLLYLAMMIPPESGEAWRAAVTGARAFIAETSVTLGHEMIQMHGGMGVSDELAIGQGHKRLMMLSRWPDDPATALDRFAGVSAAP